MAMILSVDQMKTLISIASLYEKQAGWVEYLFPAFDDKKDYLCELLFHSEQTGKLTTEIIIKSLPSDFK